MEITAPKWYDCVIPRDNLRQTVVDIKEGKIDDISFVKGMFDQKCERYCIGIETGKDTGYSHLQCRVVFKKEWDIKYVIQWFPWAHWIPSHVRDFAYCEKEGNFIRSWEEALQEFVTLEPVFWQIIAMDMWKKQNDRQITVIYDEKGGHGKSWLRKHLVATHQATMIPPVQESKDIMRIAMAKPSPGYVIDLPRAEGKVALGMWSAVEQLKDGYLWDDRYSFREKWINPPKVMVFCNDLGKKALSNDRFDILDITDFQVLA